MSDTKLEAVRLRTVRQYYRPSSALQARPSQSSGNSNASQLSAASTRGSEPDTALTAFLQLITWRLSVQRAIVSLVDRDHQVSHFHESTASPAETVLPTLLHAKTSSISSPRLLRPAISSTLTHTRRREINYGWVALG